MKMINIFIACLTLAISSLAIAMGGTPSAVCYVDGKMVSTNMPVSECQYKLAGDPSIKVSVQKANRNEKK